MEILRTPDKRFEGLSDYPFAPNYTEVDGLRIHHVDEGGVEKKPILLLHGEPTWSYLYRKMVPLFVEQGYRAVAPDLAGFGRSDKPAHRDDYSYQRHVDWMNQWLEAVDLRDITLICQDWGSLIGLRMVADQPERFSQVVLANGGLPDGSWSPPIVFRLWRAFSKHSPFFPISGIIATACKQKVSPQAKAAYEAPFPDNRFKEGARIFPGLVPTRPDDPAVQANLKAWEVLEKWEKPFLTAFSDGDPITRGIDRQFHDRVPGARGQPHTTIRRAGHFLQEDKGEELAQLVIDWLATLG